MALGRRSKSLLAVGGLVVSAAVLANGLSGSGDGETSVAHAGERPAASEAAPSPTSAVGSADATPVEPRPAGRLAGLTAAAAARQEVLDGAMNAGGAASVDEPLPAPAARAATDDGLDWTELFRTLREREEEAGSAADAAGAPVTEAPAAAAAEAPSGPDEVEPSAPAARADPLHALVGRSLRGVLAGPAGGLALLDGQVLRPGDSVPGSDFVLASVQRDRITLTHAGLAEPVTLLLAPMSPAVAAPTTSPTSTTPAPSAQAATAPAPVPASPPATALPATTEGSTHG